MKPLTTPYFEACEDLENIYLEDSYVLNILEEKDSIFFEMEFVLTEQHNLYHPPKKDEQYCYKRGKLEFLSCSSKKLSLSNQLPSIDANGEKDLGNIDSLVQIEKKYSVEGGWGRLDVACKVISVEFDSLETNL